MKDLIQTRVSLLGVEEGMKVLKGKLGSLLRSGGSNIKYTQVI